MSYVSFMRAISECPHAWILQSFVSCEACITEYSVCSVKCVVCLCSFSVVLCWNLWRMLYMYTVLCAFYLLLLCSECDLIEVFSGVLLFILWWFCCIKSCDCSIFWFLFCLWSYRASSGGWMCDGIWMLLWMLKWLHGDGTGILSFQFSCSHICLSLQICFEHSAIDVGVHIASKYLHHLPSLLWPLL